MTYFEAHKLLDRVKDGQTFSRVVIDRALELTGDIEADRSTGMGDKIPSESQGIGQSQSIGMVANHDCRHFQAQG
jgi:hypothetical protein